MFALALLFGIYSYLIFILGIIGILTRNSILAVSVIFIIASAIYFYTHREDIPIINIKNKKLRPLLILFICLALINLIGALSPEYSFDALWYHLSLPKIFLEEQMIFPVTEGIFYYSLMPKLGEMLFTPAVAFNLDVIAKLTQWVFGILTSVVVYKISRRYFDSTKSFFAVLIFYCSLVVAWESTVAYVDLIRAFFEVMALWAFLVWRDTKDQKTLLEAGVFLGLAISTKLFALGSIIIFLPLFYIGIKNKISTIKNYLIFSTVAVLTASPWFIYSYFASGNPLYPVFSQSFSDSGLTSLFIPLNLINDLYILFLKADDPISPLYIIFLPLLLVFFKKLRLELKLISIYFLASLIIWYFIPRLGGGRFVLTYLPAASIICIALIENLKVVSLKKYSYAIIILVFISTIFYRGIANSRYLPIVLGLESKNSFLARTLNFDFGDFYDTDGFFEKTINENDKVLLYGFHNIYYVNFPFIHSSYVKKGDEFNYIATQGSDLPERFKNWKLIYENDLTNVKVYSLDAIKWQY